MMITIHHVEIVKNNTCILFLYLRYLIFNLNHIHIHVYTCMHAHTHTHTKSTVLWMFCQQMELICRWLDGLTTAARNPWETYFKEETQPSGFK